MNTYPVFDLNIVGSTRQASLEQFIERVEAGQGGYACFVNAHVSVTSCQDEHLREAVNGATYAFPDGTPVYLTGRYLRHLPIEKISGPDFMAMMFESETGRKLKHYFYGGKPEVLEILVEKLRERYPGCEIVGAVSPPFRALSEEEQQADRDAILAAGAQVVWVGLGAPKQEMWMHRNSPLLPGAMLMGVGAAFDFHADVVQRAPEWMQKRGLEWLHRLCQEPRRLWKRYLVTNFLFLYYSLTRA